jgi:hypothetical protein
MLNLPRSFDFQTEGGHFPTLGNPQLGSNMTVGSFYNPQQNIPTRMMSNPPHMNQPRGRPYNVRQGHGVYHNPIFPLNPQAQSFLGGWGQMSQPRLPVLATLNMPDLSKLMSDPMS